MHFLDQRYKFHFYFSLQLKFTFMIIKSFVVIAFILIIISLGSALLHLVKHKSHEDSKKTVKALTFRITLSIILFIFVFIMIATGLYTPHGIGVRMHTPKTDAGNAVTADNPEPN